MNLHGVSISATSLPLTLVGEMTEPRLDTDLGPEAG